MQKLEAELQQAEQRTAAEVLPLKPSCLYEMYTKCSQMAAHSGMPSSVPLHRLASCPCTPYVKQLRHALGCRRRSDRMLAGDAGSRCRQHGTALLPRCLLPAAVERLSLPDTPITPRPKPQTPGPSGLEQGFACAGPQSLRAAAAVGRSERSRRQRAAPPEPAAAVPVLCHSPAGMAPHVQFVGSCSCEDFAFRISAGTEGLGLRGVSRLASVSFPHEHCSCCMHLGSKVGRACISTARCPSAGDLLSEGLRCICQVADPPRQAVGCLAACSTALLCLSGLVRHSLQRHARASQG